MHLFSRFAHDYHCFVFLVFFIGGTGTSRATWNPRGNRDWPSGTQGEICHPIVMESEVTRTYNPPVSQPCTRCLTQGDVGIQGQPGPPGPQGIGESGPPVRKQHARGQSNYHSGKTQTLQKNPINNIALNSK